MGRVKVAPTPRNLALDEAMRRAAANITSSSTLRPSDFARSLPIPLSVPHPPVRPARPSAPISHASNHSTKERSVDSQKRKSDPGDDAAPPTKKAAAAKLTLRSATKSSPPTNGEVTTNEISIAARIKSTAPVEQSRRSTRSSKVNTVTGDTDLLETANRVQAKSPHPARNQKRSTRAKPSIARDEEHQKAIAMLQGENLSMEDQATEPVESPAPARSTCASTGGKTSRRTSKSVSTSRRGSARGLATQPDDVKSEKQFDVVPPTFLTDQTPAPLDAFDSPDRASSLNLEVATSESKHNIKEFDIDNLVGLPSPTSHAPGPSTEDQDPATYTYPDPDDETHAFSINGDAEVQLVKPEQGALDGSSATSGDSGYVTSQPPQQPMYFNVPVPVNGQYAALAPATPETRNQAFQFVLSTKGQKVKGRPTPRNPRPREVSPRSGGRNVANTYPRKQPFKAQIEFPAYPPAGSEVPTDYSLWEICQNYPNNLREHVLLGFVQREWSANELCACLKDDARAILNTRPGKDKTMVFQKRMERIKKDLQAKGEYEPLLRGPMIRDDGRPTWVKRGNVRRK